MKLLARAAVGAVLGVILFAHPAEGALKKILFFSKSSGFEHDMIHRAGGEPSAAEKILIDLGNRNGFQFTCTKDGSIFTPEKLAGFDAFLFYTTGDLTVPGADRNPPMPREGKEALLDAIRHGKGFVGVHSASDTFHSGATVDPYIQMLGGEFVTHGAQMRAHLICVDRNFPGMDAVPANFALLEEWYSLKNLAPDLHVLLVQDTASMGKVGPYKRPNYPSTWAHHYGEGRVFYTSMGHRLDVWTNPVFQKILAGGLSWATGNVDADVTPNIDRVTPQAGHLPGS